MKRTTLTNTNELNEKGHQFQRDFEKDKNLYL